MKRKEILLALVLVNLFIIFDCILVLTCASASPVITPKPVKLTLISAYPKDQLWNKHLLQWMNKVAEKSNGRVAIQWRGGPEVISPFENLAPVSKRSFDLVSTTPAFHSTAVADPTGMMLCNASPMDHRKNGSFQIIDKIYRAKVNLTVLGWAFQGAPFATLTVRPVRTLTDLKGLKIRAVPQWVPVAKALGMAPITLSIPETYSGLEKGIVDGVMFVLDPTINENGWYAHLKYIVRPDFQYETSNFIYMNVDSWNQLSKEDQQLLVETIKAIEPEARDYIVTLSKKEVERALTLGLKKVEFSETDSREYVRLQFRAMWKEFEASSPDTAAKFKKILPIPKDLLLDIGR